MRMSLRHGAWLFGLLAGSACASDGAASGNELNANRQAAQQMNMPPLNLGEGRGVGSAESPSGMRPAAAPVVRQSAEDSQAPERSALGKERSRLLAEINKSQTVLLPPPELLSHSAEGDLRMPGVTLLDAAALSMGYSNEVAASVAKKNTSEYLASASLGPLLPHVDVRFGRGREYSSPSSQTNNLNVRAPYDMHPRTDGQVTARQTLFDLPSYFERQRQNILLKSAEHNMSDVQERVSYDTMVSFLKLIQLRLAVVLTQDYEDELRKLLEYVSTRAEAGGSSPADMQRVRGRVINARSTGIEAQGAYESGLAEFRRLTGVVPSSIVIPESMLPVLPKDFETALAEANRNNDELQTALRDMESVDPERRAALGRFAPKIDIELSANRTYNAGGIDGSYRDPLNDPKNAVYPVQSDKRAMLVMSWSLFNGGADLMQSRALASKKQEYEFRAREVQRKMEESLRNNFNVLNAANGRIAGVRQEMEANDLVLAAFREQLFSANRSLLDVLDAYQRQYNSRTELLRLLVSEATAGLQLLRNTGQLQEGIAALR